MGVVPFPLANRVTHPKTAHPTWVLKYYQSPKGGNGRNHGVSVRELG